MDIFGNDIAEPCPTTARGNEAPGIGLRRAVRGLRRFCIRSHSEDRKGAALRSLMPLGRMTTTIEVNVPQKQMIIHRGKTVDNIDDDMACRTKLAAEPIGSLDKLMTEWDHWGWHRVTFYGDLREPAKGICDALGLKLIEEA